MSALVDEGLTPALGFSAPNRAYPAAAHVRGVIAHLAFGLAGGFRPIDDLACETDTVRNLRCCNERATGIEPA